MATEAQEVLITVKLEATEAAKNAAEYRAALEQAKTALKAVEEEHGKASTQYAAQEAVVKQLNIQLAANQRVLAQMANTEREAAGAYAEKNKATAEAVQMAKDLSAAYGVNDERTKAAVKQAAEMTAEMKAIDKAVGQTHRNVGNYSEALDNMNNPTINAIKSANEFIAANGGLAGSFKAGGQAVMGMGKQLLMLLANPIVAIIAAISGAVMLMVKAMQSNGAAMEKVSQIAAPFKVILDSVFTAIGKIAGVLIDGVLAMGKFATSIMSVIPGLKGVAAATNEAITLEKERQRLVAAARKDVVDDAKDQLRVAELKKKIAQKDKFTTEERLKFAREVDEIERKNAIGDANRANDALKLFLNDMKVRGKSQKDLTQTERDELAKLQAAKYDEQKQYAERTKKLAGVTATLLAEIEADKQAKVEEVNKKADEAQAKREKEKQNKKAADEKAAQDELARLKKNADDAIAVLDYEAQMALLKSEELRAGKQLSDQEAHTQKLDDLTKENADYLAAQKVLLKEKQITQEQYNANIAMSDQQLKTDIAISDAEFNANQAQIKQDNLLNQWATEKEIAQLKGEDMMAYEKAQLERQMAEELAVANLTEEQKLLIKEKYKLLDADLEKKKSANNLNLASQFAGNIATIFGKNTKVGKAAASAQIAIDTYKGAMAAFSSMQSIPVVGVGLGIAAAAAVAVQGAKAIKDVWAVKSGLPGDGGGGGGGQSVSAISATAAATPAANVTGSLVARTSGQTQQEAQTTAVNTALRANPVQQVLVIDDVTSAQTNKANVKVANSL
jgi:hypothetical protein